MEIYLRQTCIKQFRSMTDVTTAVISIFKLYTIPLISSHFKQWLTFIRLLSFQYYGFMHNSFKAMLFGNIRNGMFQEAIMFVLAGFHVINSGNIFRDLCKWQVCNLVIWSIIQIIKQAQRTMYLLFTLFSYKLFVSGYTNWSSYFN